MKDKICNILIAILLFLAVSILIADNTPKDILDKTSAFFQVFVTPVKQNVEKINKNKESDVNFTPYMKKLQTDIKENWDPPKSNSSKSVVALFKIAKNGNLLNFKILTSSGDKKTDKAAKKAVEKTAPFTPLPDGFKEKSIDIQFTFDYNVFGKNGKL
jgi:TonB family protein